jgi:hypothetical protein
MQEFKDDDAGYVAWIGEFPDGFVVNASRTPTPSYLRPHRVTCHTISKDTFRGKSWTEGDCMKACAQDVAELERWVRECVKGELDACKKCKPL